MKYVIMFDESASLGLPFEYQQHPEFFDALNNNSDTERKNEVIATILRQHGVRTVLDMTCGTGSQPFYLHDQGFECTGSDFSPALLIIARERALNEHKNIPFIDGDMRTLKAGTFDAVITIFNAIGHLTKADFKKTLTNVYDNLKSGGIYIFDIMNAQAINDAVVPTLSHSVDAVVGNKQLRMSQCSTFDAQTAQLTSYDVGIIQDGAKKPLIFQGVCTLQLYTATELQSLLQECGFEVLSQGGMCGEPFVASEAQSILTVARKVA